ncbi:MAG: M14 family metallopeptidase [Pseudomonadota bacterium]
MNSSDSFAIDYSQARAKFMDAAARAGGTLERISHPERGPDGGDLSCDVAWFGPRDAERVLVMISGTHGVEGFCGSGGQVAALHRGETSRLPPGLAVLMIHAINPYGFAWLRRVTQENVDLNRNWVNFDGPLPKNAGYDELHPVLCPSAWTDASRAAGGAAIGAYVQLHGEAALQRAVSGGQYAHASGVFYGGRAPTWSRRTQTALFEHYLRLARKVAILDYHTGLGPWGFATQIVTQPRPSSQFVRAARWFGAATTSIYDGDSVSAAIAGDGLSAAASILSHAEVTVLALEVGTLPTDQVLEALCADAWLHAYGDPASPQGRAIQSQVRDAFFGDTDDWKGMVVGQSLLACRQAAAGLMEP